MSDSARGFFNLTGHPRSKSITSYLAHLHSSSLAWWILLASLIVTLAAYFVSSQSVNSAAHARFEANRNEVQIAIEKRMHEQEVALRGGLGLFNASDNVTRDEWRAYTESLNLEVFFPGLQGFVYSEVVLAKNRDTFIERVRAEGFEEFDINPAGNREVYTSIVYLEPFRDRNLRAFGYDMFSEPTRRDAMERARDSGLAAVSGLVTLVQETGTDVQRGFLMYIPVYRRGMAIETVAQRRDAIQGYVYSPFRMGDLMTGVLGRRESEIGFQILDADSKAADKLLYSSEKYKDPSAVEAESISFKYTTQLVTGGRTWKVDYQAYSDFLLPGEANQPLFIVLGGIVIDILLFLTIGILSNQRKRAFTMAKVMTSELEDAKNLAEQSAANEQRLRTQAEKSKNRLEAANQKLMRFSSIVAHDLRSPLKRVNTFVDILNDEYGSKLDDHGKDVLYRLSKGALRMRMMLDALQSYSKIGEISNIDTTANVQNVFENAIESIGTELERIEINLNIDDQARVGCDPLLLEHVAQNLIKNAVKFNQSKDKRVNIVVKQTDNAFVKIIVEDNGIGIPAKFAENVFDMFARLHNEDEYEGTGIGLAICKKIVFDFGGDIWVDTDYSDGTRIVATLPGRTTVADQQPQREVDSLAA